MLTHIKFQVKTQYYYIIKKDYYLNPKTNHNVEKSFYVKFIIIVGMTTLIKLKEEGFPKKTSSICT